MGHEVLLDTLEFGKASEVSWVKVGLDGNLLSSKTT